MADPVDIANEVVEACLAEAEARARGKSAPETHPDFDGFHCLDCGDEIPVLRLRLGRIRCVDCQTRLERDRRMGPLNRVVE
jgi:RNA polymerase-binding transcription factor DksA